jgi:predicted ATPase/DNA-binding CsgD family transcriptional regulator
VSDTGERVRAGISEREAEVLALVGSHLTNAQIAGRLVISVRTVESHVSSLLRKLGVADRRSLADLAPRTGDRDGARPASPSLPDPLTSFVGRAAERAVLAAALTQHRLVTAVGPGGVGKTRLAIAVAADVADRHADGAWYVDLVPVTDPAMVGPAVATAFGFGEQPGRSRTDTLLSKLAASDALLVLDNCEHLLDPVTELVETLLQACPQLTVLATSRSRLHVPFEFVFAVPGMAVDDIGESDASRLFLERAAMTGWSPSCAGDHRRIAVICRRLDGVALAIELAAAGLATRGLDGLEAGLTEPLAVLTGGSRLDERHRSVRSALDWSFGLLTGDDRVLLRRTSAFAAPFTATAATVVAGFPPLTPEGVARGLARLAEQNLLVASTRPDGTRYRMLETIRQYGGERMEHAAELDQVRGRHLRWCLETAARVQRGEGEEGFDELGRRPPRGTGLGGGPAGAPRGGARAGPAAGRADLCRGQAERGPGALRGGRRPGRRPRRRRRSAPPGGGRRVGSARRQRRDHPVPGRRRGGPQGGRRSPGRPGARHRGRGGDERTGRHVRGGARGGAGPAG